MSSHHDHDRSRLRRTRVCAAGGVVAALLLAACGGDDTTSASSSPTTVVTTTSTTDPSETVATGDTTVVESTTTVTTDVPTSTSDASSTTPAPSSSDSAGSSTSSTPSTATGGVVTTAPPANPTLPAGVTPELDAYIDALAADTDSFDNITTTPATTRCAAAAFVTSIGLQSLQSAGITPENIADELDFEVHLNPTVAAAIADGLFGCGVADRFAASLVSLVVLDDLNDAQEAALMECAANAIDDATARSVLIAYLTPSSNTVDTTAINAAGESLAALARACGFNV